jgi:small GTP-binding protein
MKTVVTRAPIFKTILAGEGGVGKTSLVLRYTEDRFEENMRMTIGANFASKEVEMEGSSVRLLLWDLGGQPRFHDVVGDYFRGAKFAIVVFDVNRYYTLERTEEWIARIKEAVPDCDILLVGNKTDEFVAGEGVTLEDGLAFASKFGADCLEVSAKNGAGVIEMFETVAARLSQKRVGTTVGQALAQSQTS